MDSPDEIESWLMRWEMTTIGDSKNYVTHTWTGCKCKYCGWDKSQIVNGALNGHSLRGYGYPIFKRDDFKCKYCGWDGSQWPKYLYLSVDHLIPKDVKECDLPASVETRDDCRWVATACPFCNTLLNRGPLRGQKFCVPGDCPNQVIKNKLDAIAKKRGEYKEFWKRNVKRSGEG